MTGPSLTRHLLAWTLGALVLVWGSLIGVGYLTGQHEADELTDGHLASMGAVLLAYDSGSFAPGAAIAPPAGAAQQLKAHDYQQSMSVVVWDAQGRVLTRMGDAPEPGFSPRQGFATLQLGTPPTPWRAFSRWNEARTRKIMVLLSMQERDDLADDIAEQISQPGLWLLPVVALLLGLAVWRGLRPLYRLSQEVHALDIQRPRPLPHPARHAELAAIADAIGLLVQRYNAALTRERALAGEFAHELRTPLASLVLQVRALRDAGGPAGAPALAQMERDIHRANDVMSHLLALARANRAELDEAAEPLDLRELAREVVAGFVPQAYAGGHELALAADGPFPLTGHPVLLALALRNLVENALSHTPAGTEVQVQLDAGERWIQVCDDAGAAADAAAQPAPAAVTATVADAPVRALGLGLGHRVVEKVAAIHGARFELLPARQGRGRCYRISFGPAPAAA